MENIVIFTFRGEQICFIHVMLNALDMKNKGYNIKVVLEGEAVKLIKELNESKDPLFKKLIDENLIDCVCKACSSKMGVLDYNTNFGIPFGDDLNGHPSFSSYIQKGYKIITM